MNGLRYATSRDAVVNKAADEDIASVLKSEAYKSATNVAFELIEHFMLR
jgi:hypothetical protein